MLKLLVPFRCVKKREKVLQDDEMTQKQRERGINPDMTELLSLALPNLIDSRKKA